MRIIVLGAGFGGLELSATLSSQLGDGIEVVLIDKSEGFVFGFSKLDVMFGKRLPQDVFHPYRHLDKPGLQFVKSVVRSIDPLAKTVETDSGSFQGDILVVALGADLVPLATPGLLEAGHEFYTTEGAYAVRDALNRFGGGRVIVGVTSTPFKCPPAPSETALLMHDFLLERGLRAESTISLVMPLGGHPLTYDGQGTCYLEFGHNLVGRVSVTFLSGQAPVGDLEGPSAQIAADKVDFGVSRIQRWFDRPWNQDERSTLQPAAWPK